MGLSLYLGFDSEGSDLLPESGQLLILGFHRGLTAVGLEVVTEAIEKGALVLELLVDAVRIQFRLQLLLQLGLGIQSNLEVCAELGDSWVGLFSLFLLQLLF